VKRDELVESGTIPFVDDIHLLRFSSYFILKYIGVLSMELKYWDKK